MSGHQQLRADQYGEHRNAYAKNKKIILQQQDVCGICGKPVNKKLKYPDPMSPTIDHIIPIDRGGHPSDIDNLQLAHMTCNRQKSNRIMKTKSDGQPQDVISNRVLPQSMDWRSYRPK